jgi:omega-amidase
MKIALMQMDILWEDKGQNLKKAEDLLIKAHNEECDVAVFPEMFSTGFSMNNSEIAEKPNGFILNRLQKMAAHRDIFIIAGIAEIVDKHYENRAYVIDRKGVISDHYSKNYGFSYSGEDTKYHSGDKQVIIDIEGIPSSVFICYDLRFPELFRNVAQSVSIMFVIANWPDSRIDHWNALLKARAIENQCFVVGVNSIGDEWIFVEIDERETAFVRQRFPFLKDLKD